MASKWLSHRGGELVVEWGVLVRADSVHHPVRIVCGCGRGRGRGLVEREGGTVRVSEEVCVCVCMRESVCGVWQCVCVPFRSLFRLLDGCWVVIGCWLLGVARVNVGC